jgi:hypothetical protein
MAAVTRARVSLASPTGEAQIRRGMATVNIVAGQVVCIAAATAIPSGHETVYRLAANESEVGAGIALNSALANATVDVLVSGFAGGYSGLAHGTALSVATGELNTTAPAGASRFYAHNATVVGVR